MMSPGNTVKKLTQYLLIAYLLWETILSCKAQLQLRFTMLVRQVIRFLSCGRTKLCGIHASSSFEKGYDISDPQVEKGPQRQWHKKINSSKKNNYIVKCTSKMIHKHFYRQIIDRLWRWIVNLILPQYGLFRHTNTHEKG